MDQLVSVGSFCPNETCAEYGQAKANHIIQFGKTRQGVQRYRCRTCGRTFTETHGTLLYRRRTPAQDIFETLALLAEGVRISSLARSKGLKEDTILDWLGAAAEHAATIEEVLLKDYHVSRAQIDALWTYVGHKGSKGGTLTTWTQASSGAAP